MVGMNSQAVQNGVLKMDEKLVQRIKDCSALPSLPAVAMQVLELANKNDADISEIAKVITRDAALSSKILRTVNSSFYGRSQKVATISHSMVILGLQSVKTLVLGFSLVTSLSKKRSKSSFKHVDYWKRSIYAATAARCIAKRTKQIQSEECFLAGLLMDIGMLVLDQTLGEQYSTLIDAAKSHHELTAIENRGLGMNHAEVSGMLAEHWKLPPVLSGPIAHHHDASKADESVRILANVIQLASRCADVFVDLDPNPAVADVRVIAKDKYGLDDGQCDELLNEIGQATSETAPLFDMNIANESFESVLKKANERLIEMSLHTQRQAAELMEKATNLQEQNQKLSAQANTDGLTGLSNRAAFDKFLSEQFTECKEMGAPLALLMLDLDKFKSVNDAHGHQGGDAVLRCAAKVLLSFAKNGAMAFRYGGEELAVIIPGAELDTAAAIAEEIRKGMAAKPVSFEDKLIPVTTSIGVAVANAGSPIKEAAQLLKAADFSVYAAKHGGRNCVKIFSAKPPAKPGEKAA